ncbi:MAG: hypothetical protein A2Y76_01525 [Planctomycetes bacterium RBG_13_60_9]|nr:MAG: hypothetical protein A2Y76_01525 [Planctomycetes bacterium RBG_13_60_9]
MYWRESGKQRKKALPDRALAEHYAKLKYQQLNSDVFTSIIPMPWNELVTDYLDSFDTRQLTASSKIEAARTLDHFARLMGRADSRHITQRVVDTFIRHRAAEPRQRKLKGENANRPISKDTLNKDITNLQAFLAWAQDGRRRYIDGAIEVNKVKADKRQPKPLASEQVRELLAVARTRSECWYMRLLMLLSTGLRAGDVETLTVSDIDFARNCIDSKSRKTRKGMLFRPLPARIMPALLAYVGNLPPGDGRLFAADSNTHKKWRQIRQRAGLPNLRLQDLRVTYSSSMQIKGVPLSVAQVLLEHSDPKLTASTYTNVDAALVDAVNKLPVDEWLNERTDE